VELKQFNSNRVRRKRQPFNRTNSGIETSRRYLFGRHLGLLIEPIVELKLRAKTLQGNPYALLIEPIVELKLGWELSIFREEFLLIEPIVELKLRFSGTASCNDLQTGCGRQSVLNTNQEPENIKRK